MKLNRWLVVLLAAVLPLMSGCAGFWDVSTDSSSTLTTTTLTSGVFYVLNIETSQIIAYYVKAGTLTQLGAYAAPATPITLTVAPSNSFLYLSTVGGVYVYSISTSGTLSIANSGSYISSDEPYTMQVDPTNKWLVYSVSGVAQVAALPLSTSTGLPTGSAVAQTIASTNIHQLAIAPNDSYVFVAMGTGGTACVPFTSSNASPFGTPSTISTVSSSGASLSVAVDPSDRIFYIGETSATSGSNSGGIRVFTLSGLAEVSGSPYASQGLAPYSILPLASGSYVYVANRQTSSGTTGVIAGFTLSTSSSTYALTALGSTFSAVGSHTVALVEDSSDQFVFAANIDGSYDLTGFVFDSSSAGYLDLVLESTTGTDPVEAGAIAAAH